MQEHFYQRDVIRRIEKDFPGSFVIINDPRRIQGVPDILILYGSRWAMLEVKAAAEAPVRPNQEHYVQEFGRMSYSSFIYPENEDEVFHELQYALGDRR